MTRRRSRRQFAAASTAIWVAAGSPSLAEATALTEARRRAVSTAAPSWLIAQSVEQLTRRPRVSQPHQRRRAFHRHAITDRPIARPLERRLDRLEGRQRLARVAGRQLHGRHSERGEHARVQRTQLRRDGDGLPGRRPPLRHLATHRQHPCQRSEHGRLQPALMTDRREDRAAQGLGLGQRQRSIDGDLRLRRPSPARDLPGSPAASAWRMTAAAATSASAMRPCATATSRAQPPQQGSSTRRPRRPRAPERLARPAPPPLPATRCSWSTRGATPAGSRHAPQGPHHPPDRPRPASPRAAKPPRRGRPTAGVPRRAPGTWPAARAPPAGAGPLIARGASWRPVDHACGRPPRRRWRANAPPRRPPARGRRLTAELPAVSGGVLEAHPEDRLQPVDPALVPLDQPGRVALVERGALVLRPSPRSTRRAARGVGTGMRRRVARSTLRTEELLADERVEDRRHAGCVRQRYQGGDLVAQERAADDRRVLGGAAFRREQAVEAGGDQRLDRGRDGDRAEIVSDDRTRRSRGGGARPRRAWRASPR